MVNLNRQEDYYNIKEDIKLERIKDSLERGNKVHLEDDENNIETHIVKNKETITGIIITPISVDVSYISRNKKEEYSIISIINEIFGVFDLEKDWFGNGKLSYRIQ